MDIKKGLGVVDKYSTPLPLHSPENIWRYVGMLFMASSNDLNT